MSFSYINTKKTSVWSGKTAHRRGSENLNAHVQRKIVNHSFQEEKKKIDIKLQRVTQLLEIPTNARIKSQIKFLQKYFEDTYKYTQKIKDTLEKELYEIIFYEMTLEKFKIHEIVFNQGDIGRKMYFILEGEVGILLPTGIQATRQPPTFSKTTNLTFEQMIKIHFSDLRFGHFMKQGDNFGEIALEQNISRTATVIAKTECDLAVITSESYKKALNAFEDKVADANLKFIQLIPLFSQWSKQGQLGFLQNCKEQIFQTGSYIYRYGSISQSAYIIFEGEIIIEDWKPPDNDPYINQKGKLEDLLKNASQKRKILGVYNKGQLFGDLELETYQEVQVKRDSQAKARVDTKVFCVSFQNLLDFFRLFSSIDNLKNYSQQKSTLSQAYAINFKIYDGPQQPEFNIDIGEVGKTYFTSLKRHQEVQQWTDALHKMQKMNDRNKTQIKINELENLEEDVKDHFVNKYSCLVQFRKHPYNKESGIIKKVFTRANRIMNVSQNSSVTSFSPLCSVHSILNGGVPQLEKRFIPKEQRAQLKYAQIDIIKSRTLSVMNFLSKSQNKQKPDVDIKSNSHGLDKYSQQTLKNHKSNNNNNSISLDSGSDKFLIRRYLQSSHSSKIQIHNLSRSDMNQTKSNQQSMLNQLNQNKGTITNECSQKQNKKQNQYKFEIMKMFHKN